MLIDICDREAVDDGVRSCAVNSIGNLACWVELQPRIAECA